MTRSHRRRYTATAAFAILASTLLTSCTMAKISGRGSVPLMLNNPTSRVTVVGRLDTSKMKVFDYTGAFDVSEVIAEEMSRTQASAVTNLVVTIKTDVGAFFLNVITLGLANARIFHVEGDLVNMAVADDTEAGTEVARGTSLPDVLTSATETPTNGLVLVRESSDWVLYEVR